MTIIFRCNNCETINYIPNNHQYKLCEKCGKIITFEPRESIIVSDSEAESNVFLHSGKLSTSEAEKFFDVADAHVQQISALIMTLEKKSGILLDIQSKALSDTILSILRQSNTNSLDELIRNCKMFDIPLSKIEQILIQLKKEGFVYQPKSWLIILA
ncbi:MAG: hypothetical protein KAS47_04670 [Candidatus Heimdallarchaeota archaeon]|nr:hypothetical protein [Candidatus Heimdallarchaeota archaeon]